jgi:hypothetical protein
LIEFTPNLKYLNVESRNYREHQILLNNVDIKLEQLHLTLMGSSLITPFGQLISDIKQFSSSLICLSLYLFGFCFQNANEFPFNSNRFEKFLESMNELKQFHLYVDLFYDLMNTDIILCQFKSQFWFDRNLSFGMHNNYFYTLPFHFEHLSLSYEGFDNIESNNLEILINNYRVKYFENYYLLLKQEFNDNGVEDGVLGSLRKSSFFSGLLSCFFFFVIFLFLKNTVNINYLRY